MYSFFQLIVKISSRKDGFYFENCADFSIALFRSQLWSHLAKLYIFNGRCML